MMGHETLQMIHERYYPYIKNYQRDEGKAFMENVYNAGKDTPSDITDKGVEITGRKLKTHIERI